MQLRDWCTGDPWNKSFSAQLSQQHPKKLAFHEDLVLEKPHIVRTAGSDFFS